MFLLWEVLIQTYTKSRKRRETQCTHHPASKIINCRWALFMVKILIRLGGYNQSLELFPHALFLKISENPCIKKPKQAMKGPKRLYMLLHVCSANKSKWRIVYVLANNNHSDLSTNTLKVNSKVQH